MAVLRFARGERIALDCLCGERGGDVSDLKAGRAAAEKQREERGAGEVADEVYSVEEPEADFRAKLRITRWGEKPQFNPTASPG